MAATRNEWWNSCGHEVSMTPTLLANLMPVWNASQTEPLNGDEEDLTWILLYQASSLHVFNLVLVLL